MRFEDVEILSLLLRLKKAKGNDVFSTTEIAPMLSLSQQSVSRKLRDIERKGLVSRELCASGQRVVVLDKGFALVRGALSLLNEATETGNMPSRFRGFVVSGSGEGAYYLGLEQYFLQICEKIGFTPFKGTLNVEVRDEHDLSVKDEFLSRLPIVIDGFTDGGRSFGELMCFKCRINDEVEGAILVPKRTHHDRRIVEIVAPVRLREALNLKDGDEIEVISY
ncbi:MAG: DUF120 domain-containing protein [archaeon]